MPSENQCTNSAFTVIYWFWSELTWLITDRFLLYFFLTARNVIRAGLWEAGVLGVRPENNIICFWGARSLRLLAHINYNFSVGTFGGLAPPPPHTKKLATLLPIPTEVITFFFFFCLVVACLSACSAGKRGPFLGEDFFWRGGGGGGLSAQNFSSPLRKPKAPQCPPTEKILATPLEGSGKSYEKNCLYMHDMSKVIFSKSERLPLKLTVYLWPTPHFQLNIHVFLPVRHL